MMTDAESLDEEYFEALERMIPRATLLRIKKSCGDEI